MRHPPSVLDIQMIDFLKSKGYPFIIVTSKSDKLRKMARAEREELLKEELKNYEDVERIAFSSLNGEGVDKLKNKITYYCEEVRK